MSTQTKQELLQQLASQVVEQHICSELAEQATQLVFGDGNPDAQIVFIGEAPGKNEDLQGKPFVGAAGKFLTEMLESINLTREDVYITNIVKYRPPNNRDPMPSEKAAFLPILKKQITIIKPKLIVTLGRHSMDCLLPGLKISEAHGKPKRIRVAHSGVSENPGQLGNASGSARRQDELTWVILPLFHPAAALYNGSLRQTLLDDFAAIPAILTKL